MWAMVVEPRTRTRTRNARYEPIAPPDHHSTAASTHLVT